jgi:hypothetical protein
MFLFGKSSNANNTNTSKQLFTYFTPTPPLRNRGYREKELDIVAQLFTEYDINFEIQSTVSSETGFWTVFILTGAKENFIALEESEHYQEFKLSSMNNQNSRGTADDQLELISEGDEEFGNLENFKL